MMRRSSLLAALILSVGPGCSATVACVSGSTQACICAGERFGVQECSSTGVYGACDCERDDAGVPPGTDAGIPPGTDASVPPGTDAGETLDGGLVCVDGTTAYGDR